MSSRVAIPRLLAIGGLDPTGGAGLAADARMAARLGVHTLTVASCLTVQNRHGFSAVEPVAPATFAAMLTAAIGDGPIHAVKFGLSPDPGALRAAIDRCRAALPAAPIVVDPVLGATSGGWDPAVDPAELVAGYRAVLDRVAVLTPNLPELQRLAAGRVEDLLELGCGAVLVKGGHATGAMVEDRLVTREATVRIRHPRLDRGPVHGTGCALASALAARLGRGEDLEPAARGAVEDLVACLQATVPAADGGPVPLVIPGA